MRPTVNPNVKFTYEDYCSLGGERRYEVIEGELLLTPAPSIRHQVVQGKVRALLERFVEAHHLGTVLGAPVDVVLSKTDVVQPDVLFIAVPLSTLLAENAITRAPDLVIEMLSPSTSDRDRKAKCTLYGRFGVQEYWIVDTDARTIEQLVYGPEGLQTVAVIPERGRIESVIVKGFVLEPATVFV